MRDFNENEFIMWNGNIYNRNDSLYEKKWRGKSDWAPYSDKQMVSLGLLCDKLINDFNITREVSPDNITIRNYKDKRGVYYRSNYSKNYLDVSPAFDFNYLKEKIEN